jgi:hypothetical protein
LHISSPVGHQSSISFSSSNSFRPCRVGSTRLRCLHWPQHFLVSLALLSHSFSGTLRHLTNMYLGDSDDHRTSTPYGFYLLPSYYLLLLPLNNVSCTSHPRARIVCGGDQASNQDSNDTAPSSEVTVQPSSSTHFSGQHGSTLQQTKHANEGINTSSTQG